MAGQVFNGTYPKVLFRNKSHDEIMRENTMVKAHYSYDWGLCKPVLVHEAYSMYDQVTEFQSFTRGSAYD